MIWFWLVLATVLFGLIVTHGFTLFFRNQRLPHTRTPAEFGLPYKEVRFPTKNGKRLYGWWVPAADAQKAPVLLLVHGWSRNVERVLPHIRRLHPLGFHLLAFDARHHGSSDPDGFSSMVKFAEDIQAAVTFATQQSGVSADAVGVLGLSVGGAAAILAASEDARIRVVVAVGAFCHPREAMLTLMQKKGIGPNPLIALAFRYMEWRIGARFDDIAPENRIRLVDRPVLLIHGEQDQLVPVEHARRILSAGGDQTTLWTVPGRGHSDCDSHPEFEVRLRRFLEENLPLHPDEAEPRRERRTV